MIDVNEIRERAWANKLRNGFNTENVDKEFCYIYAELAEAFECWRKKTGDIGEELADTIIFVLSLSKMTGVENLESAILRKLEVNDSREYRQVGDYNVRVSTDDHVQAVTQ